MRGGIHRDQQDKQQSTLITRVRFRVINDPHILHCGRKLMPTQGEHTNTTQEGIEPDFFMDIKTHLGGLVTLSGLVTGWIGDIRWIGNSQWINPSFLEFVVYSI